MHCIIYNVETLQCGLCSFSQRGVYFELPCTPTRTIFHGYQIVQLDPTPHPPECEKSVTQTIFGLSYAKCMVSMATHNVVFKNTGVHTTLLIFHRLLIIDY